MNGVYGPKPTSSGGNISSNRHVSTLIPRRASNGMERMCQRYGRNQNSHPPLPVQKPLHNRFIHYYISSRGVLVPIISNCLILLSLQYNVLVTVDRGGILARIHKWSMIIYGTLQAEFMETKCNGHIHRYGTPVFGKKGALVVYQLSGQMG